MSEQGKDAASITLNGKRGIEWFLGLLGAFQGSVDRAFGDKIHHAQLSGGIITAGLTAVGILVGMVGGPPGVAAGFVAGLALGGTIAGSLEVGLIAHIQDQQSAFDTMIGAFSQQLRDVEGQLLGSSNIEIVIAAVGASTWEDQQLRITDYFGSR